MAQPRRTTLVTSVATLLAVGCWFTVADALITRRASPIRRVVNVLQMMASKCDDRGDEEDRLFDEFACYCKKNKAELETSIEAARAKIPQLQSTEEDLTAEQKQLQQDIKKLAADRDAGSVASTEATDMRETEKQAFQKESTDLRNNIDSLEKAVGKLEQADSQAAGAAGSSAAAFLQSDSFTWLQDFAASAQADRLNSNDRDVLAGFLQQPEDGSASLGEIAGILRQLLESMQEDLHTTENEEASRQSAYESLMAGKQREIRTLTAAIEQKEARSSTLTVQIAEVRHDLRDTSAGLRSDEKLAAELGKECDAKKTTYSNLKKDLANELIMIREVIKILTSGRQRLVREEVGWSLASGAPLFPADDARKGEAQAQAKADSGAGRQPGGRPPRGP
jgi:chromosome segregation ATPase